MPRGIYDRSKARRRTTKSAGASRSTLSARVEQLSKELSSLSEEIKRVEGLQSALNQYVQAAPASTNGRRGPGRPPGTGRRRGRPPGSKNRPKTAAATTVRRGPGRPRKNPVAAAAAPRRRGRPRKVVAAS